MDLHITTSECGFESNADLDFVVVVEVTTIIINSELKARNAA